MPAGALPTTDEEVVSAVRDAYSAIAREGTRPECKRYIIAGPKGILTVEEMFVIRCRCSCGGIWIHRGATEIHPGRVAHGTELWKPSSSGVDQRGMFFEAKFIHVFMTFIGRNCS
jgi:hypothetical protein